jgi:hypothetical protein
MPCSKSIEDRFWEKVDKTDTCWLWTGPVNKSGSGDFSCKLAGVKHQISYNFSWVLANGPIPVGFRVFVECGVKLCVRPNHLRLASLLELAEKRFWSKVNKTDGCWLWTAPLDVNGYGRFADFDRKIILAHRASWTFHNGPIPKGMYVLHECDTPACVKPTHLFLGSQKDNMLDMWRKGRGRSGAESGQAKLTDSQVTAIRLDRVYGDDYLTIGARYGIHVMTVSDICRGKTWRNLPEPSVEVVAEYLQTRDSAAAVC